MRGLDKVVAATPLVNDDWVAKGVAAVIGERELNRCPRLLAAYRAWVLALKVAVVKVGIGKVHSLRVGGVNRTPLLVQSVALVNHSEPVSLENLRHRDHRVAPGIA